MNIAEKLNFFIKDSVQELKKVNWPSRADTQKYTIFVIAVSILFSVFLGFWDMIFIGIIKILVS